MCGSEAESLTSLCSCRCRRRQRRCQMTAVLCVESGCCSNCSHAAYATDPHTGSAWRSCSLSLCLSLAFCEWRLPPLHLLFCDSGILLLLSSLSSLFVLSSCTRRSLSLSPSLDSYPCTCCCDFFSLFPFSAAPFCTLCCCLFCFSFSCLCCLSLPVSLSPLATHPCCFNAFHSFVHVLERVSERGRT